MESVVHHADCMEIMATYPDNYFDLAVVDPPYGINVITNRSFGDPLRKDGSIRHGIDKRNGAKIIRKPSSYVKKIWDNQCPNEIYFNELFRISKNQIIWGANHFISKIPFDSPAWIVWDKVNVSNDFADCEMAWTSFTKAAKLFSFMWNGMLQGSNKCGKTLEGNVNKRESRIHPTQKPIKLYDWIYRNYLPSGGNVIDTHLGSGSNRIADDKAGNINFVGVELDKDYFDAQEKRWHNYKQQLTIQF